MHLVYSLYIEMTRTVVCIKFGSDSQKPNLLLNDKVLQ